MDEAGKSLFQMSKPVMIVIDEQRRHMDQEVGYHRVYPPEEGERVLNNTAKALAAARDAGIPVVHVITYGRKQYKGVTPDNKNPFWARQTIIPGSGQKRQRTRCEEGSVYAEIMPQAAPLDGEPIIVKKRYSGFYQTDLEMALRGLGADVVVLAGVNTNNCVMGTAFDAHARDFGVFVLGDACGSMNGPDYHVAGLRTIEAALGWVLSVDEFAELVAKPQG